MCRGMLWPDMDQVYLHAIAARTVDDDRRFHAGTIGAKTVSTITEIQRTVPVGYAWINTSLSIDSSYAVLIVSSGPFWVYLANETTAYPVKIPTGFFCTSFTGTTKIRIDNQDTVPIDIEIYLWEIE